MNNLAGLYESHGEFAQAKPLFKDCLGRIKIALGVDHPDTRATEDGLEWALQGVDCRIVT